MGVKHMRALDDGIELIVGALSQYGDVFVRELRASLQEHIDAKVKLAIIAESHEEFLVYASRKPYCAGDEIAISRRLSPRAMVPQLCVIGFRNGRYNYLRKMNFKNEAERELEVARLVTGTPVGTVMRGEGALPWIEYFTETKP